MHLYFSISIYYHPIYLSIDENRPNFLTFLLIGYYLLIFISKCYVSWLFLLFFMYYDRIYLAIGGKGI